MCADVRYFRFKDLDHDDQVFGKTSSADSDEMTNKYLHLGGSSDSSESEIIALAGLKCRAQMIAI